MLWCLMPRCTMLLRCYAMVLWCGVFYILHHTPCYAVMLSFTTPCYVTSLDYHKPHTASQHVTHVKPQHNTSRRVTSQHNISHNTRTSHVTRNKSHVTHHVTRPRHVTSHVTRHTNLNNAQSIEKTPYIRDWRCWFNLHLSDP